MSEDAPKKLIKFMTDQGIFVALIGLFVYFCFTPGFVFKPVTGEFYAGQLAAEQLAKETGGGDVLLVQQLGSKNASQRVQGFVGRAEELGLNIQKPMLNGRGKSAAAERAVEGALKKNANIKGAFVAGKEMEPGAQKAASAAGSKIAVVSPAPQKDRNVVDLSNLTKIQQQIAFIVIIAVGMTFVITTAGIDISIGCVVALAAVIIAKLVQEHGVAVPLAILVALIASVACGGFVGFNVTQFKVPPFIATIAMMTIVRGLARLLAANTKIFIDPDKVRIFSEISATGSLGVVPYIVLIMFAILAIFHVIFTKTQFGRYVLAVGGNPDAARLSGINVNKILLSVYMINSFLAGLVGCFMAFKYTNGNPEFGVMWELDVIAAVVVGGTSLFGGKGSIFRTFIGALLIGILDNGLLLKGFSSELIYIVKGLVILLAVLLDQMKTR